MSGCLQRVGSSTCTRTLYQCKSCRNVGCENDNCSAKGFKMGRCNRCSTHGQRSVFYR